MMTLIPYTRQVGNRIFGDFGYCTAQILRTDIKETETAYMIETEVPGARKEDIELIRENGVLTIAVNTAAAETEASYLKQERVMGEARRSFNLRDIDEVTISAKLENGVLFVTLPKNKKATERIEIE